MHDQIRGATPYFLAFGRREHLPLVLSFPFSIDVVEARLCSCLLRLDLRARHQRATLRKGRRYLGGFPSGERQLPSNEDSDEETVASSHLHEHRDFSLALQHVSVSSHSQDHQPRELELKMVCLHAYVTDSMAAVSTRNVIFSG